MIEPYWTSADRRHVIYNACCLEVLPTLTGVDCVVTSPPYNCGKDYGSASDDGLSWDAYWKQTRAWLQGSLGACNFGARLAVNLPWWMGKKPRQDVPFEFQATAKIAGWQKLDKIIWIKGDSENVHTSGGYGGNGSGWGTYLSPSGPAIRCASEPILIFAKGSRGRGKISGEGRGACVRGDMTKEEWMEWTIDVWFVRGASSREHPAVYPVEIPKRLSQLYTFPDEIVLDPFTGSGTTGAACIRTGRRFIGIEISREYCDITVKRMECELSHAKAKLAV